MPAMRRSTGRRRPHDPESFGAAGPARRLGQCRRFALTTKKAKTVASLSHFSFILFLFFMLVAAPGSAVIGAAAEATTSTSFVVDEHGNQVEESRVYRSSLPTMKEGGDGVSNAVDDPNDNDDVDDKALDLGVGQVYPSHLRDGERELMQKRLEKARRYLSQLRSDPDWQEDEAEEGDNNDPVNATTSPSESSSSSSSSSSSCRNAKEHCLMWSVRNECRSNPSFMNEHCGPVCFACHAELARKRQGRWLRERLVELGADLGTVQLARGTEDRDHIVKLLEGAREYLRELDEAATTTTTTTPVSDHCYLHHHDCAHWATNGNCGGTDAESSSAQEENDETTTAALRQLSMIRLCAPLCRACHLVNGTRNGDGDLRPSTEAAVNKSLGHDWGAVQNVMVDDGSAENDDDEKDDDKVPNIASVNYRLDDLSALLGRVVRDREYLEQYKKEEEELAAGRAKDAPTVAQCRNRHEHCTAWSIQGECQANAKFMARECPVSCRTCARCRKDPNGTDVWGPGDLDRTFERILADPANQRYRPRVLSRPTYAPGDAAENATYQIGMWLLLFDQLLTEDEAAELLRVVQKREFDPSRVLSGFENSQSVNRASDHRTSYQTWCTEDCDTDPAHRTMVDRISNVTGIPEVNFEATQVPRYVEGQYYHRHNDCILQHEFLPSGPRILTAFVYLNDVEAGGGTDFPVLNLTAMPKPGRAVLWPSVHNDRPNTKDDRADHAALVVEKGIKYGANIWIHQRDYKNPHDNDCS